MSLRAESTKCPIFFTGKIDRSLLREFLLYTINYLSDLSTGINTSKVKLLMGDKFKFKIPVMVFVNKIFCELIKPYTHWDKAFCIGKAFTIQLTGSFYP